MSTYTLKGSGHAWLLVISSTNWMTENQQTELKNREKYALKCKNVHESHQGRP